MSGDGRVAVVTGSASGLGAAFAVRLAELGFDLALCDLDEPRETAEAVRAAGRRAVGLVADVSEPEQVRSFAEAARAELGPCAVLVNNVGVSPFSPFEDITLEDWRRTMSVNLDSLFLVTRAFIEDMKARAWGRVVNLTTAVCWDAERRDVVHYATSKMGVVGFTRSLATEMGAHGITVNCICPGVIKTPLLEQRITPEQWQRYFDRQPIKRYGEPADLLGALQLLVSDEGSFMTGVTLPVHGGRVWV
jgi:NAD(P)-dependent dehydrogenase (short-subunit alcohol dehydrogenase family)